MTKFWMTTEDPMYDEDGVLVDEDADWEDIEDPTNFIAEIEAFNPHNTVNS